MTRRTQIRPLNELEIHTKYHHKEWTRHNCINYFILHHKMNYDRAVEIVTKWDDGMSLGESLKKQKFWEIVLTIALWVALAVIVYLAFVMGR